MFTLIKKKIKNLLDNSNRRSLLGLTNDIEYGLQLLALKQTVEFVDAEMTNAQVFPSRLDLLEWSFKQVSQVKSGLLLEFGVWMGKSISFIAGLAQDTVYGFDSFEGLPEEWRTGFDKGIFKLKALPAVPRNVTLVKGWFNESLPPFLEKEKECVRFLHIDCDLYSSTKTVLELLASRMVAGTVIVFDEFFNYPGWRQGEYKAFMEFIEVTQFRFKYLAYVSKDQQVAVVITQAGTTESKP